MADLNSWLDEDAVRIVDAVLTGWMPVRRQRVLRLLMLIDPPPIEVDGSVRVFRNPMAAQVLTQISAEVRAMLEESPR